MRRPTRCQIMPRALLDYYKAIESASRKMLEAAEAENWDEVVRHEGPCAVLIARLRQKSLEAELSLEERREKVQIMQRILRNDARIRCLAEPWLNDLEQILDPQSRPQPLH